MAGSGRRGGGGGHRGRGLALVLCAGAAAVTTCTPPAATTTAEQRCCDCLTTHQTPRGVPCDQSDGGDCLAAVRGQARLLTAPACLREVCADACRELGFRPPARATLDACCACLASSADDTGQPCVPVPAARCADALDDGERVSTAPECLDRRCGSECVFLGASLTTDGGAGD
jgi:hypothetical protein